MIANLHGPWLLAAALVLILVVIRRCPRPRSRELWLVGAIVFCAAAARLACGLWAPLHVNGQGPLWIRGAIDPAALLGYGPGYFELFHGIMRIGAASDQTLFAANALLSALSPALLYAAARLAGVARGGALAVSLVLAADAVSLRTAASEGYFASIIALVLFVQVMLALALRAHLRHDRFATALALGAVGLLGAAAARIHPMAYVPLALCPLVVLGATQPGSWAIRLARASVAAVAIAAVVVLTSGAATLAALRASSMTGHAFHGLTATAAALVLGLLAAVCLLQRWLIPRWLPLLAIGSLAMLLATQDTFLQHPLWQLCYQRILLPGMLLGAAPLLPARLQRAGWAASSAALLAAALLRPALPYLGERTTEQLEYGFLQKVLREMPPGCTLASVGRTGNRVWASPSHLLPTQGPPGTGAGYNVEAASDLNIVPAAGECLLYVRSSLCSSDEARALCESIERESTLDKVASRTLPAAPSYLALPYDRADVEVVLFRVRNHRGASQREQATVGDGAAISPAFARTLYDRLVSLREPDGCKMERLDTSRFRMTVGLQTPSGAQPRVEIATAPPGGGAGRRAGRWALAPSSDLERDCGATLAGIERVLAAIEGP